MRLFRSDYCELHKSPPLPLHRHRNHELFLCVTGAGRHHTEYGVETVHAGDLCLFPPEQPHMSCAAPGEACTCRVQFFPESLFDGDNEADREICGMLEHFKRMCRQGRNTILAAPQKLDFLDSLFSQLTREYKESLPGSAAVYKSVFTTLLVQAYRATAPDASGAAGVAEDPCMQYVFDFISTHYAEGIDVSDVVKLSGLGKTTFFNRFKRHFGKTFVTLLNELRCEHAARLLVETDLPLDQVAARSGFKSLSHFYMTMRKTGAGSPVALRKRGQRHAPAH